MPNKKYWNQIAAQMHKPGLPPDTIREITNTPKSCIFLLQTARQPEKASHLRDLSLTYQEGTRRSSMDKLGPRFLLSFSLGLLVLAGAAGCHRDLNAAQAAPAADNSGPDPADANLAPVANNQPRPSSAPATQGAVLGVRYQAQSQQSYEQYPPQQYPPQQTYPDQQYPPQ